jgi:hypothetical protein
MLIQKNLPEGEIYSFKLVNGDEIVSKLIQQEDNKFILSKPLTVVPSAQGIGLLQSLFCGDINNNNMELLREHVLLYAPVVKEMQDHYLSTTTGIKTVSKGSIVI